MNIKSVNVAGPVKPGRRGETMVRRHSGLLLCLCLLLVWLFPLCGFASVKARLSQGIVMEGETLVMQIEADGMNRSEPDLSPLEQNFEILGTSTGTQLQIFNGQRSEKKQWSVTLRPKSTGDLDIPAIMVDGERTRPLKVRVSQMPDNAFTTDAGVWLDAKLEESQGYVQQQLRLNVKLWLSRPLINGDMADPVIENALVERLSDDRRNGVVKAGKVYTVIERQYAVFPQASGELVIPAVRFNGELMATAGAMPRRRDAGIDQFLNENDLFDLNPFGRGGEVQKAYSAPIRINIKPRAEAFGNDAWIPASAVTLSDSWREQPPDFLKGEPVSRTIVLEVKGLQASQLPELKVADVVGLGVYPEKPVTSSYTDGIWVYARSTLNVSYVPRADNRVSIPAVDVAWWNTYEDAKKMASLQAWSVDVSVGEGAAAAAQPPAGATPSAPVTPVTMSIWWGLILLIPALWLMARRIGLAAGQFSGKVSDGMQTLKASVAPKSERALLAEVAQASEGTDPHALRASLLAWANRRWPDQSPMTLAKLAALMPALAAELDSLDRRIFAQTAKQRTGQALWAALKVELGKVKQKKREAQDTLLKPLYPEN